MKSLSLFLAIMALGFCGCHPDDVTNSGQNKPRGKTYTSPFGVTENGVYAGFEIVRRKLSAPLFGDSQHDEAAVALWSGDSVFSVFGGAVTANGTMLNSTTIAGGGTTYSNRLPTGQYGAIPYTLNGSFQVFDVSGSASFGALRDSVRSPAADLSVQFPVAGASLSKSAGFTVQWNGASADVAHVMVVDSATSVGHQSFGKIVGDNGSYTVSPSDLSNLTTGPVTILVSRGNYKVATAPDGRKYTLTAYSQHEIHATLTQ